MVEYQLGNAMFCNCDKIEITQELGTCIIKNDETNLTPGAVFII